MCSVFTKICEDFESKLVEFDGENNYVHLLVLYPPKITISVLVNSLKGVSSRKLRQHFPVFNKYIGVVKLLYGAENTLLHLLVRDHFRNIETIHRKSKYSRIINSTSLPYITAINDDCLR